MTFRNHRIEIRVGRSVAGKAFSQGPGLEAPRLHWNGQTYRFQDTDFQMRSRTLERYGKNFMSPELIVQDWGCPSCGTWSRTSTDSST